MAMKSFIILPTCFLLLSDLGQLPQKISVNLPVWEKLLSAEWSEIGKTYKKKFKKKNLKQNLFPEWGEISGMNETFKALAEFTACSLDVSSADVLLESRVLLPESEFPHFTH